MSDDRSTTEDVAGAQRNKRGQIGRRIAIGALTIVVAFGVSGWLGVHAETTTGLGASGYQLKLTYPRVARAGLDIPWELRLTHIGGFHSDITVAISANYFDIFEYQGMHPNPSDETSDGQFVYLTFSPPKSGDVFTTSLDTYVQPSSQQGRHAVTSVIIDGHTVASVSYDTTLLP